MAKLLFGEYESLEEMATNVNGGQKSELIEHLLYKQMMKLLKEDNQQFVKNYSLLIVFLLPFLGVGVFFVLRG